jgi:hypothetical protein
LDLFQFSVLTCLTDDLTVVEKMWQKEVDTNDIVEKIKTRTRNDWFRNQSAGWNNQKTIDFSQTLSKYGTCFTFNTDKTSNIYRVEE